MTKNGYYSAHRHIIYYYICFDVCSSAEITMCCLAKEGNWVNLFYQDNIFASDIFSIDTTAVKLFLIFIDTESIMHV